MVRIDGGQICLDYVSSMSIFIVLGDFSSDKSAHINVELCFARSHLLARWSCAASGRLCFLL